jgi:hypothetical protein
VPYPVPYFAAGTPFAAKLRNLGLYADDGSVTGTTGVPTGIAFNAHRPVLLECIEAYPGNIAAGAETRLDVPQPNTTNRVYWNLLDTSAISGPGADEPGQKAQYEFGASLAGSAGDGTAAAGGWHIVSHVIPLANTATGQMLGANLQADGSGLNSGSRQACSSTRDNAAFYLDIQLANPGTPLNPSVVNWDTATGQIAAAGAGTGVDAFSGETPRFLACWAGVVNGSWDAPGLTPSLPAPYATWATGTVTVGTTGSATVNVNGHTGLADVANFLASPPLFRNHVSAGQSIPNTTNTKVTLSASGLDTFGGYSPAASTYTVQRDGLYLAHGAVAWNSLASDTAQRAAGISVNGTIYWGPGYENAPVTLIGGALPACNLIATKTQVFSLRAGDTVQLWCRQNSGAAVALSSGDDSRMFLAWLGAPGVPSTLWQPPDTSFRWQPGTPAGQLPALFQQHLANDLGFLVNRPYLLAYQASTETSLSQNAFHRVNMDTVTGIVHGDNGDSYSGWDGTNLQYTSQRAGWYLCVAEYFTTFPTSPPTSAVAAFSVPASGGFAPTRAPDWYQHMLSPPANFTPGATAVGLYYLLPGETVQPQAMVQDNGGTWGTAAGTVNGGQVNSHLEVVWICE